MGGNPEPRYGAHRNIQEESARQARARLTAAAPDLLRACEWASKSFHHPECRVAKQESLHCNCHVEACRKAVAKATG